MPVLALDTLRRTARAPATWALLGLGLGAGWAGFALAILALGSLEEQALGVVTATTATWSVLLGLHALARALDQDATTALTDAVDAGRPGALGRIAGRWAGAAAAGIAGGALLGVALVALSPVPWEALHCLYSASFSAVLLAVSWGVLLAGQLGPRTALGGGLLLWLLGHLPWGSALLLPGTAGHVVGALLPGPRGGTLLGAAGLLLVALALQSPRAAIRRG